MIDFVCLGSILLFRGGSFIFRIFEGFVDILWRCIG